MALTIEQKIAQKEAELARLKSKQRKNKTAQKIVIGATLLKLARMDQFYSEILLKILESEVMRELDKKRIQPVIAEIKKNQQ